MSGAAMLMIGVVLGLAMVPQQPSAPRAPVERPLATAEYRARIESYCARYRELRWFDECVADRLLRNGVR